MIYVILGQTASGKTSLALSLARRFSLPVISADAYQCYRMMQIGTDKPTREEVAGIDYHFYDEYDPDFRMNVSIFQKECGPLLKSYVQKGKDVLIVGGTFLYIKALLYGYAFYSEEEEKGEKSPYDGWPLERLQAELRRLSEKTCREIDMANPRRVLRALEQIRSGHSRDEILQSTSRVPLYPVRFFRIEIDKEEGNRRIDQRVDRMFEEGFPEEVDRLLSRYPDDLYSFQSIGYRELIEEKRGSGDLEKAKALIKTHTHQYAKKQRTFLRHQFPEAVVLPKDEIFKAIADHVQLKKRTDILLVGMKEKMEDKKVLMAGLGGVGDMALDALVRVGCEEIEVVDQDKVDPTNLNRQTLYTLLDIGKAKSDIAKRRAESLNPLARVTARCERIDEHFSSEKKDVILDCIDDVNGKVALFKKAKAEKALFITSAGFGFHTDSTKVAFGCLQERTDPLSRNFIEALTKEGMGDDLKDILVVYPKDARRKGQKGDKTIGSVATAVNAAGLAIASLLVQKLEKEVEKDG